MAEYLNIPSGKSEIVDGFSFLGLENFNSLITDVKFEEWGQTVLIHFIDVQTQQLNYRIVFSKCDKIEWFLIDSHSVKELEADVIDFQIIENKGRSYACFYTDIFELSMHYMNIKIEKDW